MPPKPLPGILDIEPYKGGESVLPGIAKPIKLASNENALGASAAALKAFADAASKSHLYPEGRATVLRNAIAARYGLDPERIVCGAGSDEIFHLLGSAYLAPGDEIVQSEHGFLVYRIVAQTAGAATISAPDRDFTVDVDAMLAAVTAKTKMVFLANPNNPTGTYLPFAEVRRLHAGLPEDVLLVIDAAYAEYVRRNDYEAGVALVSEFDNVVMTRTFSKIHGLAALRLGWAYGPAAVIDVLNRIRTPFNVSTAAQMAGVAAIEDTGFVERTIEHNASELDRVSAGLQSYGITITPSVGNFVLAHLPKGKAADADAFLRSRGLIVRRVAAYGLPDALRISIGTTAENDALLAAMKDLPAS
ncbi:MAG: histidinol-phosphate transaminase [Alphaproteobacteria bacterium]|nr:histidinol-phosphate transaminase [Alphaproteobacteria bacterium]